MPLTRKGRVYITLFLLLLLGGAGYYVYWQTGTFTFSGIWNRWFSDTASSTPARMNDAETKAAILQSILRNSDLRLQPIDVDVSDRAVTLRGNVETPLQRASLEQLVQGLAGSRTISSSIAVGTATVGTSPTATLDVDARLPKEVEFALYKTDAFEVKTLKISSQNRIIHLAGSVRSLAEKLLAERIAREVPEVRGVVNDLEIVK